MNTRISTFRTLVRKSLGLLALTAALASAFGGRALAQNIIYGFGDNLEGQLTSSVPLTADNYMPTAAKGISGAIAISAGGYGYEYSTGGFTLALKSNGTVWAWGDNRFGQLGTTTNNNNDTPNATPAQVAGLSGVTAIAAGGGFSLALRSDGTVWAWGNNFEGQLGSATNLANDNPNPAPAKVIIAGSPTITAIAAGLDFALVLDSTGKIWAWGDNFCGELGSATNNGNHTANPTPTQVSSLTGVIKIAAGGGRGNSNLTNPVDNGLSLAETNDGTVWAWGCNVYGELGNTTNSGSSKANPTPVSVSGLPKSPMAIAAGWLNGLVLDSTGNVWAWGDNISGQLGKTNNYGDPVPNPTPAEISNLPGVTAIAAGGNVGLAVKGDGTVWAWGSNLKGQLGNATNLGTGADPTPTQVSGIAGAVAVSAGGFFSLVLTHENGFYFNDAATNQLAYWTYQIENGVPSVVSGSFVSSDLAAPWKLVGTADFNGDGQPDLLWWNASTGQVAVWYVTYANGVATVMGGAYLTGATTNWHLAGVADFNNDGYPDLLWQNATNGAVAVWFLHSASGVISVTGGSTIVAGNAPIWSLIGATDFNHDGYPDLLWRNTSTGDVVWWQLAYANGAVSSVGGGYIAKGFPTTWRLTGVEDLNGDGEPDLVFQNSSTGQLAWWELGYANGAVSSVGGGYLTSPSSSAWVLSVGF